MNGRKCECTSCEDHKGTCGQDPYSWSAEHGNKVFCVGCYENWIPRKDFNLAVSALAKLTPAQKQALKEALN